MNRTLKNIFILFWATAVLAICVSSLINFHQHKIWGKPILTQLLYAKRDKEKTVDLLKDLNPDLSTAGYEYLSADFASISDSPFVLFTMIEECRFGPPNLVVLTAFYFSSKSLRAPPVA